MSYLAPLRHNPPRSFSAWICLPDTSPAPEVHNTSFRVKFVKFRACPRDTNEWFNSPGIRANAVAMMQLLLVFIGGGFGSMARFLTGRLMGTLFGPTYPWGTLTVNLVGGLLMGLLAGTLARFPGQGENWRLLLGVGVLGGYTTFSSFALDTVNIIERGDWPLAFGYALVSLIGSILAVFLGMAVVRAIA